MILELKDITKIYSENNGVSSIEFGIEKGEFVTLLGPSGCGKSTILNMIGGFLKPDSGQILMEGEDITSLPPEKRPIATVFQNYALFPHLMVEENVSYGLRYYRKLSKKESIKSALYYIELVGLSGYEKSLIGNLSGGQQQRVALARAIATQPKVLLLDEPLSNLDVKLRVHLRNELKEIQKKTEVSMVFVTHDQAEALSLSDRIVVMEQGKVAQIGSPQDIYYSPKNRYVAEFVGKSNIIEDKKGSYYMVRPEDVELKKSERGTHVVERTMFLGEQTDITLSDGQKQIQAVLYGRRGSLFTRGDRVEIGFANKVKVKLD